MSDDNVLKEFLIALGFKVDDATYRKFTEILGSTDNFVKNLAASAGGAVTAVDTLVTRVASGMEQVYYSSQRFRTTAQNIQGLGYAFKQIGLNSDQAIQSVGGLANAILKNPGLNGWLSNAGINPSEDRSQMLLDLYQRWKSMPTYQAFQEGGLFGQDQNTMLAVLQGYDKIGDKLADYKNKLDGSGVDPQKLAQESMEFDNQLSALQTSIGLLKESIAGDFIVPLTAALKTFDDILTRFEHWNKDHGISIPGLGTVHPASASAAGGGILAGLAAKWGIGKLWGQVTGANTKKIVEDAVKSALKDAGTATVEAEAATTTASSGLLRWLLGPTSAIGTGIYYGGGFYQSTAGPDKEDLYGAGGVPFNPNGKDGNNPGNIMTNGVNNWQGATGGTAIGTPERFISPFYGLRAMAMVLQHKYAAGLDTLSKIIPKYDTSPGDDIQSYISDVMTRMGITADTHLDLTDPGTMRNLMEAMVKHETGKQPYSDSLFDQSINAAFSGSGGAGGGVNPTQVSITQTNTFSVSGAQSPKEVSAGISEAQQRVNGDLVRNLKGYGP